MSNNQPNTAVVNTATTSGNDFFGRRMYIIAAIIAGIPIFIAAHAFADALHANQDEAVGFATTVFFLAGVFAGRYIVHFRTLNGRPIRNRSIVALVTIIIACTCWIFILAAHPLMDTATNLLAFWLPFIFMSLSTGMLIKMVRVIAHRQLMEARSSAAKSQSELNLLQSQLSPHFLFNTLNNMYGLSITQHEKIPPLLLKLSELLRYSVYEASETFVRMKDEVAYINNYIEFEKLRIGDKLVLSAEIEQPAASEIRIAPMLLIVFIENAFKHSKNTADKQIYIDISLKTWENFILFTVKNSQSKSKAEKSAVNKSSGYGMVNVMKRLEILYPNEHTLEIRNEEDHYKVVLQLKMK